MINRSIMKSAAKAQIKGNIGILFACHLVIGLISALMSPLGVGFLIAPSFVLSCNKIYIALAQRVRPSVNDVWKGFHYFGKALWLAIITSFFTFAWSLLLVIPGIVKGYSYLMAPYILADNPGMTAREALSESKRMTNGHKFDLFVLGLSFIGWFLLIPITLGLIMIWLVPYTNATLANYYLAMKDERSAASQSEN
ncbi:MAG: hypothetical protein K0S22_260 [Oscillospiraceae bacterium]|nr:hypothetical protein [Oscillospiraceae bacterium]